MYVYTGAGHIIRISSKSWFISLIPFKKWNLYKVYIHSTQTDIFQVFISFNFNDYNWQLMKTPNSVSQKIRILWKGSILKTPGVGLGDMAQKIITIIIFISVDIDNYHDKCQIFISFKFKARFLLQSESFRNQTINFP